MINERWAFSVFRASGAAVFLLAAGAHPSSAQQLHDPPTAADLTDDAHGEPIDLAEDRYDRMTVAVNIDGKGPFSFIVDTGAQRTMISQELATKLGLVQGRTAALHSLSGFDRVQTFIIPTLNLNKRTVKDIHAPAIARTHLGAAGILGVDSLVAQRVMLDFKGQTMRISPSTDREHWDPDTIVVNARSRFGHLVLVDASADDQKVSVIVDTGAQVSVGNEALRRKLLGKHKDKKTVPVQLVGVTGGAITADFALVDNMRIAGITMTNMPIAFADVHAFRKLDLIDKPAMLLGMDTLRHFRNVSLDFASKKVRFLLPEAAKQTEASEVAALGQ